MIELRVYVEPLCEELPRHDRLLILRAQLTLLRKRVEQGIPIELESIRRAEDLAHSLESVELPK
jgi:hypothetical protein